MSVPETESQASALADHLQPNQPAAAPSSVVPDLASRQCKACRGDGARLRPEQVGLLLPALGGWETDGKQIYKTYRFKNYYETMAFVNASAWISHRQDHHPDLDVGYNRCTVRYSTHDVGGLSENDFICAAKIEALMRL